MRFYNKFNNKTDTGMYNQVTQLNLPFNIKKYSFLMDWTVIFSGSVGVVVTQIANFVGNARKRRRLAAPSNAILKVEEIYSKCMKPILDNTPAERCAIIAVENGGQMLMPGSPIYVSVVYNDYRKPLESVVDKYQRLQCDKDYIEMLSVAMREGYVNFRTEKIPDTAMIKPLLVDHKIKYTEIHFIAQTEKKMYMLSIVTTQDGDLQENHTRAQILLGVNSARNIFRDYIKYS